MNQVSVIITVVLEVLIRLTEAALGWVVGSFLGDLFDRHREEAAAPNATLLPAGCGNRGIDLAQQRLVLSSAFGTYFSGLLERGDAFVHLRGQIRVQAPPGQKSLPPLQRIYWALQYAKGPRLIIFAGEGGLGKTTIAANIVRIVQ